MKFSSQNMLCKQTGNAIIIFCFINFFVFFSCKKEAQVSLIEEASTLQSFIVHETLAFKQLKLIPGISDSLKVAFDGSYCKYSEQPDGNKLWIVALKKGSFGFAKSKAFISEKNNNLSIMILSYEYDRNKYKNGDFTTYTGTISFYNGNMVKIKDLYYDKGKLTRIAEADCPTCSLCSNCAPPAQINWCTSYPELCSGGGNGDSGPGEWQNMQPGESGGGGPVNNNYSSSINYLIINLNLPGAQANWLNNNPALADQIYVYLNITNSSLTFSERKQIAYDHLFNMMSDATYLSFVNNHSQTSANVIVWWEDTNWLSNPNNFNLDIEDDQQLSELTAAELALALLYPFQAYQIKLNVPKAFEIADLKMGTVGAHIGLNDKKDAFRHAYFQAINTRDVLAPSWPLISSSTIVGLFSMAHESETPPQLALEEQMDSFNNNVGITYCWNCLPVISSNESIANDIITKMNNGDLRYLRPLDHTDPYWYVGPNGSPNTATDGIVLPPNLNPTILTPTNQ